MDEAAHLEILVRVTLNLAQQRHIYPQGLLKRLTEAQAAIVRELVCNNTPRPEWLADWGKKDDAIQAAAKDPAERVRIARLAAEARWRGHVKRKDIEQARKTIQHLADKLRNAPEGYIPDDITKHPLGDVHPDTVLALKREFGIDVTGYAHVISEDSLSHAIDGHSSISDSELQLIPDIHGNWDRIAVEANKSGKAIRFEKDYGSNTYIVVDIIGSAKRRLTPKQLYFKTTYIAKKKARRLGISPSTGSPSGAFHRADL